MVSTDGDEITLLRDIQTSFFWIKGLLFLLMVVSGMGIIAVIQNRESTLIIGTKSLVITLNVIAK